MYRYPQSSSAFSYGGAAWSNDALSDEGDDGRLMVGGCSSGASIVVWD